MKSFALVARCTACGWLSSPYETERDLREYDVRGLRIMLSNLYKDQSAHWVHKHVLPDGLLAKNVTFEPVLYQRVEQKTTEQVFADWGQELLTAGWISVARSPDLSLVNSRWHEGVLKDEDEGLDIQDAINRKRRR